MSTQEFIGQWYTQALANQIKKFYGHETLTVWLPEDKDDTEYNPTRLNVLLADDDIIYDIYLG